MIIDDKTYKLSSNNYISIATEKNQIVLGHTFNHDMRHVAGWQHRYNGKYRKTAAFTVDKEGIIHNHFDPKYCSEFFQDIALDKKTIVILIENDGWLLKDTKNNAFITWIGDIYNEPNHVVEKRWRGYTYWSPYNDKQLESAAKLVKMLCDKFSIPQTAISHNTKIDKLGDYQGVLYKSNIEKHFTDLSPSWDCELFKNKIELT